MRRVHHWTEVPVEPLNDLVTRQVIHTESITISRLVLREGAIVYRHSHPNEQVSTVETGRLRFVFDDETIDVHAGESMQIPRDVPHSVEALEDSVALDVFSPVREDWLRGEDAYLRGSL